MFHMQRKFWSIGYYYLSVKWEYRSTQGRGLSSVRFDQRQVIVGLDYDAVYRLYACDVDLIRAEPTDSL
jgi:hypothetical protein